MTLNDVSNILDAAVRIWLHGITIPREFKTKIGAKKPIPESRMPGILHLSERPGTATIVVVDGMSHNIYCTFFGPRIWVDRNWNTEPPSAEGDVVMSSVSRVVHEMRDKQVAEATREL